MNGTLQLDPPAEMQPMPVKNPTAPLEALRFAVEKAMALEATNATGIETSGKIAALHRQIEECSDEREAVKLLKALNELETTDKLHRIRTRRLEHDTTAAWQDASRIVTPAVLQVAELVGEACNGIYDKYRGVCLAMLSPLARERAQVSEQVAYTIDSATAGLAAWALAVGPSNVIQSDLQTVRTKSHAATDKSYASEALRYCDEVMAQIPDLKGQAARIEAAHAAVMQITASA